VPAKAVNELNRLLQDKGDVEIKFGENQASFALKDDKGFSVLLITKLIEGNYPNYRQVIPAETKERMPLSRGISAGPAPRRNHDQRKGQLRQAHVRQKQPRHHRQLAGSRRGARNLAVNYKGKEIAIAFNPRYLIDPLAALTEDEVFFELIDELSPGVLKINGPFLYVVMPMRLRVYTKPRQRLAQFQMNPGINRVQDCEYTAE
jgi:DNA polymerase-3 subunit beta